MADADYTDEIWKIIPFAPDYAVSDMGRIKRITPGRSARMRVLKDWASNKRGHRYIRFPSPSGLQRFLIHRLVLTIFVGPPPTAAHECAHSDGNPANNRLDNLRWATSIENNADKFAHGTNASGERHGAAKLTEAAVREIRASKEFHHVLAARFGVGRVAITKVKSGQRWSHVK